MPDAIDLFGGAGGAAMGMHLLGLTEHGIEWGEQECATRTAAGFAVTRADVSELDPSEWAGVEGMWASPPCPDWSVAGKGKGRDGKSGWLVDEPIRWAKAIRPRWIAMENVPPVEVVFREQALELQAMGYWTWVGVLSAEEYGVPQTRRRAHLMASLDHPVGPPAPTHQGYVPGVPAQEVHTWSGTLRPWVSMAEALGWGNDLALRQWRGEGMVERHGERPDREAGEPAFAITEANHRTKLVVFTGANSMRHSRRSEEVVPYSRPIGDPAPTVDGKAGVAWKFDRPATTIAGDPRIMAPVHHDNGSQGKTPIDADADAVRRGEDPGDRPIKLTAQEALALQAMPTNYPLAGSRTAQFRQVGNLATPFTAASLVGEVLGLDWVAAIDALNGR